MIAIKRLKNILWILIVAFGALTAYLISLRVATERNAVQALERNIFHVRGDIRYLETEFEARANMRQLEKWNSQDYRYVAPQAAQYLPDERSLARLDGVQSNGEIYVAPPVMMAMVDAEDGADENAVQTAAVVHTESPAPAQIREDESMLRVAVAEAPRVAPVKRKAVPEEKAVTIKPVRMASEIPAARPAPDPVARKAARMALLDAQLLDDRTLRDLGSKAAAEAGSRNR
ncbi:hypothetical protein BH10PSE13_BH10PSE13_19370 [soil metagenome]